MSGVIGFIVGGLVVGGILLGRTSADSDTVAANGTQATTPSVASTATASGNAAPVPSHVSSEGPPPVAPVPPPTAPPPAPVQPTTPNGPTPFSCTVTLRDGPTGSQSVQLIVEGPPDVATVWGVITSGNDRTGGAIALVGGRGEQLVTGFRAKSSQVVIYADPSMNPAFEACRSES